MIKNLLDFSNFIIDKPNDIKPIAMFSIYKIEINKLNYLRNEIKKTHIHFNNINSIVKDIQNIENDFEYSLFSLDKEIIYDNKKEGGRISINIANIYNVNTNNNLNNVLQLFPFKNINLSLMHRFYLILSSILLFKNYYIENIKNNNDLYLDFILSLEGIILQRNVKNIKIVISIDKTYDINSMNLICKFIKKILNLNQDLTFKFNYHNDINKNHIIK